MMASAVLLHEGGHLLAFFLLGEPAPTARAVLLGISLDPRRPLSYRRLLLTAAAGPFLNLLVAIPLLTVGKSSPALLALGIVNAFSALVNLLPIGRCDGGRILFCLSALLFPLGIAERISRAVGLLFFFLLAFSLLYLLLGKGGAGAMILILPLLFRAAEQP